MNQKGKIPVVVSALMACIVTAILIVSPVAANPLDDFVYWLENGSQAPVMNHWMGMSHQQIDQEQDPSAIPITIGQGDWSHGILDSVIYNSTDQNIIFQFQNTEESTDQPQLIIGRSSEDFALEMDVSNEVTNGFDQTYTIPNFTLDDPTEYTAYLVTKQ